jgi:hypothetical protein
VNTSAAPARLVLDVAATLDARCEVELALAEFESLFEQLVESSKSPASSHQHIRFTRYRSLFRGAGLAGFGFGKGRPCRS